MSIESYIERLRKESEFELNLEIKKLTIILLFNLYFDNGEPNASEEKETST